MSDPTLAFRCPDNLRELLEERADSRASSVTAVILDSLQQTLSKPAPAHVPGALEVAVVDLLGDNADDVEREAARVLAKIADQASGVPSVSAVDKLLRLVDVRLDSVADAEAAAFRRELAAASGIPANGR